MNPINNAENSYIYSLTNRIEKLEEIVRNMTTNPQKIGNSIAYATFVPITLGPFTIPGGGTFKANAGLIFMNDLFDFYYDGKPALNRATLLEPAYTITVDTDDFDHALPYGGLLTPQQRNADDGWRSDFFQSNFTEASGQRYINFWVKNTDSSTHTYWLHVTALIPRPALKPQ